jgi:hypothetical protein
MASARRKTHRCKLLTSSTRKLTRTSPTPSFEAQLASLGGTALPGLPADFGKLIADETEKWGKVVKCRIT